MQRRAALAAAAAALAAGCAPLPPAQSHVVTGRFSVATGGHDRKNTTGRYRLARTDGRTELDIIGLLGATAARVRVDASGAELVTAEGTRRAGSADELLLPALGFTIPVEALFSWLDGKPAAGIPSRLAAAGFEQSGWTVEVKRRNAAGQALLLSARRPATGTVPEITVTVSAERGGEK